ncbi:MAG: metallophosphoesterase [Pseudomonadota bacterium]
MFRKFFGMPAAGDKYPAQVAPDERIYAVGDIHGRHDLLHALLKKIHADVANLSDTRKPRVIFLGDYIDRGDRSRDVVKTLSGLCAAPTAGAASHDVRYDFLAGNHEISLLKFLEDPLVSDGWLDWGGLQTLASFGLKPTAARLSERELLRLRDSFAPAVLPYLEFLRGLPRIIVSGDIVFVHAALDPECSLEDQPDEATLWGKPPSGRKSGLRGYKMVHGHFAETEPVSLPERICVDTGAYFSGRLTAVRLDDTETFLSVSTTETPPLYASGPT